jgi:cysteine desulfurase / selenocysteine lyase
MTQPLSAQETLIDWKAERLRYAATSEYVYLNAGSRGLLSKDSFAAGLQCLQDDSSMSLEVCVDGADVARDLFAKLIHARHGEIAITKNVSEGLNTIARAVQWRAGDNLVMCSDIEHANNVYLWQSLRQLGVEIRDIESRQGALDLDRMTSAIDERTRIVTTSSISFTPGYKADLATLGNAARRHGALFLVDAVQSCGVSEINVESSYIDALATATSKGLLGLRGLGFLYVRQEVLNQLTPTHIARTSIDVGTGHYSQFEGPAYTLRNDARRFECGNLNHLGASVVAASLKSLLRLGVPQIEQRANSLARALSQGLIAQGWPVLADSSGNSTHLVCMGVRGNGGADRTGDPRLDRLSEALVAAKVRHSIRRNLLRFGFHFYNDESDVQAVLDIAKRIA